MDAILDDVRPLPRTRVTLTVAVLVICCVLWGWSFPTMQIASRAFDAHTHPLGVSDQLATRALLNGIRFGIAGVLYVLLTFRHQRRFSRSDVLGGLAVGSTFGTAMILQVLGLTWARPSVSGFLTALAVVFAPVAQAGLLRRPVGRAVWGAVGVAMIGMVLLSWPNPSANSSSNLTAHPPLPLLGEITTVLASMIFTAQILALDHYGQSASPVRLTSIMFLTTAVISLVVAGGASRGAVFHPDTLGAIAGDRTVWWTLGTLVLFSSVVAMHLMNTFQPLVSPAVASVVYCCEPLFATLFSVLFATERLVMLTLAGGAAVLVAVLMVALKPRT